MVAYDYNDRGYLTREYNAASGYVYREVTAQDALGNITKASLNNGTLSGDYDYHAVTGQMLSTQAGDYHNIRYDNGTDTGYDSYGNLTAQRNIYSGSSESYSYDNLHRLTRSQVHYNGDSATIDYGYDVVGNFQKKTDYSTDSNDAYTYVTGSNKIKSIALKSGGTATFRYDSKGNQTHRTQPDGSDKQEMWYNAFNKPTIIKKNGQDITLSYGPDLMRYRQIRRVDGEQYTTWYIGKHFEVEEAKNSGLIRYRHYISDVAIVDSYNNQYPKIAFTHKDRLGSTVTMTDENNTLTSMRHFDAFGKPRGGDWSLLTGPQALFNNTANNRADIRRGFTDHEHLDEAELIHMNGRVYDYNVGRFMSVDPVIQSPANSQSINPYSYIMNNPMSGTDPTGYCAAETGTKIKSCVDVSVTDKDTGKTTTKSMNSMHSKFGQKVSNFVNKTLGNGAQITSATATLKSGKTVDLMSQSQTNGSNQLRPINSANPNNSTEKPIDGRTFAGVKINGKTSMSLNPKDLADAAADIGTDEAAILAVGELESLNDGFLPSGDPKILFEAHKFSELTGGKFDASHPNISSPVWDKTLYSGGQAEHMRLAQAMALDADAAIKATSWGRFQILGENYRAAGFNSVQAFRQAMVTSEFYHLRAFVNYVRRSTIRTQSLQNHNWSRFANNYNGPNYRANHYHTRLRNAYRKYSSIP